MRVVQINAVYGTGSTGHIVQDIHTRLIEEGYNSYVMWAIQCVGADEREQFYQIGCNLDHKIHALLRRFDDGQGFHSKVATMKACRRIKEIRPDIVHLHNLHSNYIHLPSLLSFLGREHIAVLVTLHDCWFFTGQCTHFYEQNCQNWINRCIECNIGKTGMAKSRYQSKMAGFESIEKLGFNGVSEWTTEAGRQSPMFRNATMSQCIYNWVDTKRFYPRTNGESVREKYAIAGGKKLILGVSQGWSPRKGLNEFVRLSEEMKETAEIIMVGDGSQISEKENLRCIGFTGSQEELIELYSTADVFVNPSRMETFGLVTIEALACGTPVVAYDNTGSHEIVNERVGMLAKDGCIDELISDVKYVLAVGKGYYRASCLNLVSERYNKNRQIQEYIKLYNGLIEAKQR